MFSVLNTKSYFILLIKRRLIWKPLRIATSAGEHFPRHLVLLALVCCKIKYILDKDFIFNYKAVADSEKVIRGATYFIKNGDKLEGILCINHDTSELVDVMTKLISLENLGNFVNILGIDAAFAEVEEAEIINKEKLENSIEDILCEYLDFTLLHSDKPLSLRQRENAVQVLFDKGIFNIKGAIPMVAKYLKISEPSVYRYLKAIKEKV